MLTAWFTLILGKVYPFIWFGDAAAIAFGAALRIVLAVALLALGGTVCAGFRAARDEQTRRLLREIAASRPGDGDDPHRQDSPVRLVR